jgi:hypothetical protein
MSKCNVNTDTVDFLVSLKKAYEESLTGTYVQFNKLKRRINLIKHKLNLK